MLASHAPNSILIPTSLNLKMLAEIEKLPTEEACGLLAGKIFGDQYAAEQVIPTANILHSPFRYQMDPAEQLAAFVEIENQTLELVGIYHSHLSLPTGPSETDIREAYYPEAAYLIWSRPKGSWECRGYAIQDGVARQIEIILLEER
jgi:[CysO sulfur-carrier protein]-S-L-cysteine hydrolase